MAVRTSKPSIAELRAVTQPPSIFERNSGEHWAGRLYIRRASPYLTRLLLRTPLTPNAVTWLMLLSGVAAAGLLTLPGLGWAVAAVLAIQLQILLDCTDGEMARWRGQGSMVGVYLDRLAHYVTETALPIALGIRADGGWDSIGGWTTLGLVIAVLVLLVKSETVLVHVARSESGKPPAPDTQTVAAPRGSLLARLRRAAGALPFFRAFVAMEFTLLALVAAIADTVGDDLDGTRTLVILLIPVAVVTVVGHGLAILTSSRLK
jgi:phosphatidylglycerophosphate synthase